jgi:cobalamin-dependent methionine synthase I
MGLVMQAVGTERIEALCDSFCAEFENARPRFSPGYGDLKRAAQQVIFEQLDCARQIGLTLNDSLVMSPSKAVTAIVGLVD